jgi:hypothetical protein
MRISECKTETLAVRNRLLIDNDNNHRPKTQRKPSNTTPGSTTSLASADYAGKPICESSLSAHCKTPPQVGI